MGLVLFGGIINLLQEWDKADGKESRAIYMHRGQNEKDVTHKIIDWVNSETSKNSHTLEWTAVERLLETFTSLVTPQFKTQVKNLTPDRQTPERLAQVDALFSTFFETLDQNTLMRRLHVVSDIITT